MKKLMPFLLLISMFACKKDDSPIIDDEAFYFPPNSGSTWETKSMTDLGWNTASIQTLKDFLVQKNTKSFMILVNGRIVMEEYFDGHTKDSTWAWNSAGKTLVSTITSIAQQESLLAFDNKVSDYIGFGWTSAPLAKENLIKVRHLMSMTSGLNDSNNLVVKSNLSYIADAGTRWAYGNVFQKLMDVVASASSQDFSTYFNTKLRNKIGMDGFWNNGLVFKVYHSNTRSMARYGLLVLSKGKWNAEQLVNEGFFNDATSSSQTINPSYGYFWWLNGKSSFMLPGSQTVNPGSLVPDAPLDMYSAMGAQDQRLYVVPSKNMVVIRMGGAANPSDPTFALSGFDNELWQKLNLLIK